MHFLEPYIGWKRYTNIKKLLQTLALASRLVLIHKAPSMPFGLLAITNITLTDVACYPPTIDTKTTSLLPFDETESQLDVSDINNAAANSDYTSYPVDDRPSCAAYFRCTSPLTTNSTLC